MADSPEVMNIRQASEYLGISPDTLYKYVYEEKIPAFKLGEKSDPLAMYLCDIYTIGVNLAGLPAISVPCGFTSGGLPIGLQLIGQPFREADLLAIAQAYEQAHEWKTKHPKL